jgi:hypothetical protein
MRTLMFIAAFITVSVFAVSCASSPKKGGEPTSAKTQTEKKKSEKTKTKDDQAGEDYKASAERLQVETEALMGKAKGVKADVAMREEYAKAQAAYDEALKLKKEGNHKKAAKSFEEAKALFEEVYGKTGEKRARAAQSIEKSQKEIAAVEEKAEAAGVR